jgi:hypothetical protein
MGCVAWTYVCMGSRGEHVQGKVSWQIIRCSLELLGAPYSFKQCMPEALL